MINTDTDYFFDIVYNFSSVLPLDLRKENLDINDKEKISKEDIIKILEKYFINENNEQSLSIEKDVEKIIESIIKNEDNSSIVLISVSRFSIALKIGTKVLKIGFPKITYKYPNCRIVLDSLIRKQYYINDKAVLFVEVQNLKNCELENLYSEEELNEIVYQLWKTLRKNGLIWYDPKIKNIALDDNYKSEWNEKYYKLSSEEEKGRYNIDNFIDDKTINKFVIVDTDLFLPIDVVKKINEIYKQNEDLAFFKNWKYPKMLEYENRFNKEGNI